MNSCCAESQLGFYVVNVILHCYSTRGRSDYIFKTIKNATISSAVFLILKYQVIHLVYVSTSFPFVRERLSQT